MERETEHVRMLDAGRLQLPFAPLVTSGVFATVANDKFAALAHGNQYGLTFVPTSSGFAMATQQQYIDGCKEFTARKLTAIDHGQNASHVDIPALATQKEVELAAMAHVLSLSPDEQHLAVAYGDSLALFEVAAIYESASPLPYHTFHNIVVDEISWSPDTKESSGELKFAVLTHAKTVLSCSTNGTLQALSTNTGAVSVAWSPTGESIAVGTEIGSVDIFTVATLVHERSIGRPDCCEVGYEAHHVKWAEEDMFLVGYRQYDAEREETLALACLFEAGECVELDELVAFCDFEGRKHQYYSVFLADWRMFFVGCSLSADIELLVADPETGDWEVWKALEKYQARLPMNSNDDEMYPVGLSLNLNTLDDIEVDDGKYPPPAVVSCVTTDGLLINFSFVDLTVRELLPFVQPAELFSLKPTRTTESPSLTPVTQSASTPATSAPTAERRNYTVTTSDVENVPASEDSDDGDLEEEKEEERQKASEAFAEIDAASSGVIDKSRFGDLLVMLGTTYGEESHGNYATRLADASGVISRDEFIEWYVEWIFGEHDSEDEDEDNAGDQLQPTASATANALAKFAMAEGSWRCESCMVHNQKADAPKCISCESPNPNFKGTVSSSFGVSASTTASDFKFGISSTTSSFRFGVDKGSTAQSESSTGFSFGVPASSAASSAPTASSGGFKFGFASDSTSGAAQVATSETNTSGFQFNATGTSAKQDATKPAVADKQAATRASAKDDEGYGKNADNAFATASDDEDSDEEEERKEEEDKARLAFAKISSGDESIPRDKFPALFKALGSTYSEEEHSGTCDSLDREGRIFVDDFISWYLDWLFGGDEESDEEDEDDGGSASAGHKMKSPEEIAAALAKFQPKEGSWKCDVCFTMNPTADAQKCSSCESPNPAAPKVKLGESSAPSLGSIGSGGFTLAPSSESNKPSNFKFGFTPSTTTSASAGSNAQVDSKPTGFTFGFTPAAGANSAESVSSAFGGTSTASTKSSFSFGIQPSGAGASPAFGSGFSFGTKNSVTTSQSTTSSSSYPPDTTKRAAPPPPPGAYPPDTTKKVAPPPPPGAYPPDTTKRAAPPPPPGAYPPDTTKKVAPPPPPGAYPPDTTKRAAPPPPPGAYPPDTTKKVAPPPPPGAYPPDTTKKVAPPPPPGAYPPDTTKKVAPPPPPGAYPPDTTKKIAPPPPPGAYPPDTTKKVAPPPPPGAYPPDTTKKVAPPPPPGAYPPSTATKPAPPPFTLPGSTSKAPATSSFSFGSMGNSLFGSTKTTESSAVETKPDPAKPASVFSFASSTPDASAKTAPSPFGIVPKANPAFSFSGAAAPPTAASSTGSTATSAFSFGSSTPSSSKTQGAPKGSGAFGAAATTSSAFSFASSTSVQQTEPTLSSLPKPAAIAFVAPTRPALSVPAPTKTSAAPQRPSITVQEQGARPSAPTIGSVAVPNAKPFDDSQRPTRATASSPLEAQLWKLIIDFDRAFRRVNHSTQNVCSSEKTFQAQFARQMSDLQTKVSSLWDEVNLLDDVRDQIEKDVLFVIGSDGDVHEQLEYGREILASFKNEKLKRLLEEQPLDQRSEETRKTVQDKLAAVEQACDDLDRHIASTKNQTSAGAFGTAITGSGAMSTAHLFRALKQTYDSSKIQYNRVSQLAQQLEVLSMANRNAHQGVRGLATAPRSVAKSKDDMVQIITQADTQSRNVRRSFLALCNNVVTPRDVSSAPRRKQVPSATPSSPRDKAFSRLMPRTQVTVASPISSIKSSSTAISFKDTPVKAGSKLFALAEDKAAPKEAKTFIPAPQKKDPKASVRLAPQRPSIPTFGGESSAPAQETEPSKSNEPPAKRSHGSSRDSDKSSARKTLSFDTPDFAKASFGGESSFPTPKAKPSVTFNLPGETTRASASGTSTSMSPDYKERLTKFYEAHNPARVGQVAKTIEDFKGKEEEMFRKLFMKYIPGSTDNDVQKFLQGGPVPPKPTTTATGSVFSAPSSTGDGNRSSFSFKSPSGPTPAASPFGKVSTPTTTSSPASVFGKSAFSLNAGSVSSPKPAPATTGGFSAFGKSSTSGSSVFGAPTTTTASNHKQRLIEFYTKHNPSKLGDVDATLEKYKGNEEKLFQNLAIKYKVNDAGTATTAIGFGASGGGGFAPKSPAASPFGNASTFSSISLGGGASSSTPAFGTSSAMGFGTSKPAAAAASSQSPFVTAPQDASTFRSASFGATSAVGGGGGFASFGATSAAAPAFGATCTVGAFGGGGGGGVDYRDKLTKFYQQYNPEKLGTVAATLEKYKGNEAKLFQMLEQKYMKTGAPTATSAFGAPSTLGVSATGPPAFGAPSALGGTSAPTFGASSGLGGASAAPAFGARFGATSAPGAAPAAGGGFSAFSSQPTSFGSFGGQQGGSGFGGGNAGGFGTGTGGFGSAGGFGGNANQSGGFGSTGGGFGMR